MMAIAERAATVAHAWTMGPAARMRAFMHCHMWLVTPARTAR